MEGCDFAARLPTLIPLLSVSLNRFPFSLEYVLVLREHELLCSSLHGDLLFTRDKFVAQNIEEGSTLRQDTGVDW